MKQQQCIHCFPAATSSTNCSLFYITPHSLYREDEPKWSHSNRRCSSEAENKSPVLVVKIQCSESSVSIYWSQIFVLRETEATLGEGHWAGSWCWLQSVWGRILCRNWREYTCRDVRKREATFTSQNRYLKNRSLNHIKKWVCKTKMLLSKYFWQFSGVNVLKKTAAEGLWVKSFVAIYHFMLFFLHQIWWSDKFAYLIWLT